MKNKKGLLGLIGFVLLLVIVGLFVFYYWYYDYPLNKSKCENEFKEYNFLSCMIHLRDIELCEDLDMTWIKTDNHFFVSREIICYKNGEIVRI